ncbi:MAG: hypothetical protein K2P87_01430 [Lachnospiraceae bacterium]|nr:hypothetical protein [Lachnospiraceae bacterium]
MKRFTLLLLTLILTFVNLPETTFAKTNDEAYIDEDMAKTLSIMFISTNFNTFSEWNTNTRISEVISLI